MTKFSSKLKTPCLWPIFGPFSQFFLGKKIFLENQALSCTTSRRKDGRTEGQMNRQTLLYRTLPTTARGPKKKKKKKKKKKETPTSMWEIIRTAAPYTT